MTDNLASLFGSLGPGHVLGAIMAMITMLSAAVMVAMGIKRAEASAAPSANDVAQLHAEIAQTTQDKGSAAALRLVQQAYQSDLRALDAEQRAQAAEMERDPLLLARYVQGIIDKGTA